MPQLSIIVPIYNVEAYLPRCLDSILAQTFTDFEAILIDDGSPDRCGEIMEEYAAKDSRFVTIHQENKGVSAARNAGLDIASGNYIGFVDPDDWIDPEMYDGMIRAMKKNGTELCFCDWRNFFSSGESAEHHANVGELLDRGAFLREVFAIPRTVAGSNCNKLFKRELIRRRYDETLTICEDNKFLCEYCLNIQSVCYVNRAFYTVNIREDSSTRKIPLNVVRGLPVRREMIDIVAPIGEDVRQCAEADFLDTCLQFLTMTQTDKRSDAHQIVVRCFSEYMRSKKRSILLNQRINWKLKMRLFEYSFKNRV